VGLEHNPRRQQLPGGPHTEAADTPQLTTSRLLSQAKPSPLSSRHRGSNKNTRKQNSLPKTPQHNPPNPQNTATTRVPQRVQRNPEHPLRIPFFFSPPFVSHCRTTFSPPGYEPLTSGHPASHPSKSVSSRAKRGICFCLSPRRPGSAGVPAGSEPFTLCSSVPPPIARSLRNESLFLFASTACRTPSCLSF
jgi:hypothetical protein